MNMVCRKGCYCGDLVDVLGLAQSTVSYHLKVLREAGLVRGEEQGTWVCYCADRDRLRAFAEALGGLLGGRGEARDD